MPNLAIPDEFIGKGVVCAMEILSYADVICPRCKHVNTHTKESDDFIECQNCEYRMEFHFCQVDPDFCDKRAQVMVRAECLKPRGTMRVFLCGECYSKRPILLGEAFAYSGG